MKQASHAFLGFHYFLAGLELIFKPGLKRFVIIPLAINIILFTGFFFVAKHYMSVFNLWFAHMLPSWLQWLATVLWFLFFTSFFVVIMYTFVTIANLLSAPFNSFLAEKVELYLTARLPEQRTLTDNLKDIPRILGRQLSILSYYLPRALCILILFFIPGVQTIAPFLWFLFNAWCMTLTYIDYPTDNHRVPIARVRQFLRLKYGISMTFGISILVMTMLPVINFFAIPAAVAGATKFWVDQSAAGSLTAS